MTDGPLSDVAVLFDLDGTLVETAGDLAAAMNHVLASRGHPTLETSDVRGMVGFGARAMLVAGFEAAGVDAALEPMDAHVDAFIDYYVAHIDDHSAPFEGALAALDALAEDGAALAVCTNKREDPARRLLTRLNIADRFEAIIGGDTGAAPKPHRDPIDLCLRACGRSRGIFVGDSDTDIAAAVGADLPAVIATFGYGPTDRLADAVATFDSYEHLHSIVRRLVSDNRRRQT